MKDDKNKNFEDYSDIEVRHNEVDSILNNPPVWLVRVGSYMIYGLVLIIILIAAIIKYPDTATAEITINAGDTANIKIQYSNIAKQINLNTNVNIELNNYPARDFGTLAAKISSIEYIANMQQYSINILLPQEFTLSNGTKINRKPNLKGKATIALNNKSLLQRVIDILLK
jgi:hypothetical protein